MYTSFHPHPTLIQKKKKNCGHFGFNPTLSHLVIVSKKKNHFTKRKTWTFIFIYCLLKSNMVVVILYPHSQKWVRISVDNCIRYSALVYHKTPGGTKLIMLCCFFNNEYLLPQLFLMYILCSYIGTISFNLFLFY